MPTGCVSICHYHWQDWWRLTRYETVEVYFLLYDKVSGLGKHIARHPAGHNAHGPRHTYPICQCIPHIAHRELISQAIPIFIKSTSYFNSLRLGQEPRGFGSVVQSEESNDT